MTTQPRYRIAAAALLACGGAFATGSLHSQTGPPPPGMVDVTFPSGSLTLHGAMYRPEGKGPFPALLYNHGSGANANRDMPEVAKLFTSRGYVFFLPHRRGHGRSADQGPFINDLLATERKERGDASWDRLMVKLHETDHLSDQLAGLTYLKAQPFVDPDRIVIGGCSFGGIQTVLASERQLGVRAALDFAGAAMTWADAPSLRERLSSAVRRAAIPVFFLQAENDYNTDPSKVLSAEMKKAGKAHQMKIYPPFGTTKDEGHGGFCRQGGGVWADDVFAFIEANMPKRAARLAAAPSFDLLIRDGRIIDGSGNPWFHADVGVRDGRIAEIGRLSGRTARRTIDARGRVVTPGFIDIMGGNSVPLLQDPPSAESKLRQGITSMLVGEGGSVAPQRARAAKDSVEGVTSVMSWRTFAEYFRLLETAGIPINVQHNVGAAQVRQVVIGDADRTPTPPELERMKALVAEAMRDGAMGISSALVYPPGSYASTEELIELARVAGRFGGVYLSHIRNESRRLLESMDEALEIGKAAGVPVHIYHLKAAGSENWPLVTRALEKIAAARAGGQEVTTDVGMYTQNGVRLVSLVHPRHLAQGAEAFHRRLSDPAMRRDIRRDLETDADFENFYMSSDGTWENILVTAVGPQGRRDEVGLSVAKIASRRGIDPWDAFFALLEARDVGVAVQTLNIEQRREIMRAPFVSIHTDVPPVNPSKPTSTHPKAFGAFPRILAQFVREDRVLTLEDAVRKMSSLPATTMMLYDRGRIGPGFAADLLIFDPEQVRDTATFSSPLSYSTGMDVVIVNGQVVIDEGRMTGAKPGLVLRHRHNSEKVR